MVWCEVITQDVQLARAPNSGTLVSLDKDDLSYLKSVYVLLFSRSNYAISDQLPSLCKKYPYIYIGSQRYGSKCFGKNCNSGYIQGSWTKDNGTINTESYILYPGEVQHYLNHSFMVKCNNQEKYISITLAVVNGIKQHLETTNLSSLLLLNFPLEITLPVVQQTFYLFNELLT